MPFTFKLSKRLALIKSAGTLALLAGLFSCEPPGNLAGPQISHIVSTMVVVPESITLQPAQAAQFVAYGRTQTGDSVSIQVTWKAIGGAISTSGLYSAGVLDGDYPAVATLVPPAAIGVPTTAALQRTAVVHVRSLAQIVVVPKNVSLQTGGTQQFAAFGKLSSGDSLAVSVTWAATGGAVSSSGLYTAGSAPGGYVVSASAGGITGSATVTATNVPVASVVVSPTTATLSVGGTVQLSAIPKDASGSVLTGRVVTWTTSNSAVATVSASGLVTSVAVGSVTITASSEGISASAAISVANLPVATVVVSPATPNMSVGGTVQLSATPKDASGSVLTGRVVTWTSANPAVATVSATGLVTGVAVGVATITATSEGQSGTAAVTVSSVQVASVAVSPATATLSAGGTVQLSATPKDASGGVLTGRAVTWTSANPAIATVSAAGLVTAVAPGSVTITATSEGISASATISVANLPVATVVVSPATPNMYVGGVAQLTATPKDVNGTVLTGRVVTWTSANPAVATVSATGLVTGVAVGVATITATSEGQSGTAAVTVSSVPVASVVVSPATATLSVGGTVQLSATPKDASGTVLTGRVVMWTTSNSAVATVSASGLVSGVAAGSVTITATSEGISASAALSVANLPVASVVVSPATPNMYVGGAVQLTATPKDVNGTVLTGRVVTWTTSNSAVATVSASGLVTGVAVGVATITATSEGQSGTAAVTVSSVPVASVVVSPATANLSVGGTVQLSATPKDASGTVLTGRAVTWTSANPAIATVSAVGLVTAVAPGSVTITATSEGISASAALSVTSVPVASVAIAPVTAAVFVGATVQLTATLRDAAGNVLSGRFITWASSAPGATVSATGLVTGVAAGSVTITATSEGKTGSAAVTVNLVPVASVSLSPPSASITVGQTVQLTATLLDANGLPLSGRLITWASSAPGVASVSGGLVAGIAPGTVTITATSEGKSGASTITVTAATGGGVVFQSNWTTALGQTAAALQDLSAPFGPWTTWDDGGDHLMAVVAGGPPGYANSLRVQQRGGTATGWGNVTFRNMLPPSQDFYVRFYMMNNDNQYDGDHIVVNEIFSWGNLTYIRKFATNTNWLYSNNIFGCTYTYPIGHWFGRLALTNGQWYRFEYWIHYVDATHMQVHERIYDASGALIMGDADIQQEDYNATPAWNGRSDWTLASYYAAGYNFCVNPVQMANFSMGNNGQGGALDTGLYWYYAGVQIRTDHWAGP